MRRVVENLGDYRPHLRAPGMGVWRWEQRLALASEPGVLRIGFWGVGSAFSQYQGQSNIVLVKGDTVVFVDLGSTTTQRMAEFGLTVHDIPNLVITHSHADHVGSVEELGLKRRYEAPVMQALKEGFQFPPAGDGSLFARIDELRDGGTLRTPLWVNKRYARELWDQTLAGGMAHSEVADEEERMDITEFFDVRHPKKIDPIHGRECWSFTIGEGINAINVVMFRTPHIPSDATSWDGRFWSCGFLIDDRVLYSGDTQFDPWIFEAFGERAEAIFHDCQSYPGGVHAWYGDLKKIDDRFKNKMFLYHCDDGMRPLNPDGRLGGLEVCDDGFAGFAEAIPVFYEWD